MRGKILLLACCGIMILSCIGCSGNEKEKPVNSSENVNSSSEKEEINEDDNADKQNEAEQTDEIVKTENIIINTEYVPVSYRENALIVQRSEDMELFGVLNNNGEIIVEPEYDELKFVEMDGEDYISVKLGDEFGIFKLDGSEYIEIGEYDEIVTAGDIGWLAKKDDKQYFLDTKGKVDKELNGVYKSVVGNAYLFKAYDVNDMGANDRMTAAGNDIVGNGDLYDLNENLILSGESIGIHMFMAVYGVDFIDTLIDREGKYVSVIINAEGNVVYDLGSDEIVEVDDKNLSFVATSRNQGYGYVSSDDEYYEYDIATQKRVPIIPQNDVFKWDYQVIQKESGDFSQFYTFDEEEIIEGRFADYEKEDRGLFLKNIDSQWGLIDYSGKVLIPFGDVSESDGDLFYQGEEIQKISDLSSDGKFGFYIENDNGYEVYIYDVMKEISWFDK